MPLLYYSFLNIIFGFIFVFLGRHLHWLFIVVVGFIFSQYLVEYLLTYNPDGFEFYGERVYWLVNAGDNIMNTIEHKPVEDTQAVINLMVMIFTGICIVLPLILRNYSIIFAGFYAGAVVFYTFFKFFYPEPIDYIVISLVGGSTLGAVLCVIFAEYALIILSAALGAMLMFQPFYSATVSEHLQIAVIFTAGLALQFHINKKKVIGKKKS